MLLKKIKNKFKFASLDLLIKISLFLRWPWLTALIFSLATTKASRKGEYTVLALGRSVFTDDLNALAHFSGRLKYRVLHLRYLDMLLQKFIDPLERPKISENNYYTHDFGQAGKIKVNQYLTKMFSHLIKFIGFDAVMTGNLTYIQQQEFADVCQKNHVPFITFHKEGLGVGVYRDAASLYQDFKFIGDMMMFYNQRIKDKILELKLPGFSADKLKVVGVPRFDWLFAKEKIKPKNQIVFFSFYIKDRFSYFVQDEARLEQVLNRCADFHKWVMEFAVKHPDINVVVKTKAAEYYLNYVLDILKSNFKQKISNLKVVNSGDASEFIYESMAVVGYGSSTLIEAILADKPIISPYFGDFIPDRPWDYFHNHPQLVNYAKTFAELEEYLMYPGQTMNYSQTLKSDFLQDIIANPDGKSSRRAEDEVIKLIKFFKTKDIS